jgi:hypothetical protein
VDLWTEAAREIPKRAVVVDAESDKTSKTTLRSERSSVLKNNLTGPTLLEMSGYSTDQELAPAAMVGYIVNGADPDIAGLALLANSL